MPTKPLTLSEVSKLVEELSTENAMNDERIQDFIGRVEDAGKNILNETGDSGQYCDDASTFLLAAVVSECMLSTKRNDLQVLMTIVQNPKIAQLMIGYAFIYAVGLCAVEELH